MCLTEVHNIYDIDESEIEWKNAYKIMRCFHDYLVSPFQECMIKQYEIIKDKSHEQHCVNENYYLTGFHLWVNKEDAIIHCKSWNWSDNEYHIYSVRYRKVTAHGMAFLDHGNRASETLYGKCVVAREMVLKGKVT